MNTVIAIGAAIAVLTGIGAGISDLESQHQRQ